MEFDKNFLKEIQKKNKKKSKDKHAWGWFQNRNAGIVPYNNAMFNMMMGSADAASDISGIGTADGGIGSVGTVSGGGMGESYQENEDWLDKQLKKTENNKEENFYLNAFRINKNINPDFLKQIYADNKDKPISVLLRIVKSKLTNNEIKKSPTVNKNKSTVKESRNMDKRPANYCAKFVYNNDDLTESKIVRKTVDDIKEALHTLIRDDANFVYRTDEEFDKVLDEHFDSIKNDYYETLYEYFNPYKEQEQTDECIHVKDTESEYDYEDDPDLTYYTFEKVSDELPKFSVKYSDISKTLREQALNEDRYELVEVAKHTSPDLFYAALFKDNRTNKYCTIIYDSIDDAYEEDMGKLKYTEKFDSDKEAIDFIYDSVIVDDKDDGYEEDKDLYIESNDKKKKTKDVYDFSYDNIDYNDDLDECEDTYIDEEYSAEDYSDKIELCDRLSEDAVNLCYKFFKFNGETRKFKISPQEREDLIDEFISDAKSVANSYNFSDDELKSLRNELRVYFTAHKPKVGQPAIFHGSRFNLERTKDLIEDNYKAYRNNTESVNKKSIYDDSPLNEAYMSELDMELDDPKYKEKLERNVRDLKNELHFLRNQAPKEIRKGGAFESQEEIDDAIETTQRALDIEQAKLDIINKRYWE